MAHVEEIEEQLHRFGVTEEALEALLPDNDPNYRRFVSQSTIRTASSGVVTGHDVHEGEVIDPSSELLTVTDLSVVWVIADVSERDLSLVRSGQPVSVRVEAYPNELFRSDIACTSDIAERASRTARVRCVVQESRRPLENRHVRDSRHSVRTHLRSGRSADRGGPSRAGPGGGLPAAHGHRVQAA